MPCKFDFVAELQFFCEIVILLSLQRCSAILARSRSSGSMDAHISVSSTIFLAQGSPRMITSDWQHHSSDDAFSPIGALKYRNFPCGRRKVVMRELSLSNPSWNHPCTASIFAKNFALGGIACRISVVWANRCIGLLTCLLSSV